MNPIDEIKTSPSARQWNSIGIRQHHGVVIPLFALHSQNSCGIGEYTDLPLLFSWLRSVGLTTIQLLPLNDTGQETSPYSALSAFALNPIHLGLHALPGVQPSQLQNLKSLTDTQRIPYPDVLRGKMEFLRSYYASAQKNDFTDFKERNSVWCRNYAIFKAYKLATSWKPWESWPASISPSPDDVDFHEFVQFLCFSQFEHVKRAAEQAGITLKGDIPILINRESADVWSHKDLFFYNMLQGLLLICMRIKDRTGDFPSTIGTQ